MRSTNWGLEEMIFNMGSYASGASDYLLTKKGKKWCLDNNETLKGSS